MTSILDSNLLSTKDASALSGYNADYLSRLCRSGKIAGTQIGRTWLVNRESLQQFVREQEERKQQIATELSQSREKEYQDAQEIRITAAEKTTARSVRSVQSPFTALVRTPAFALVLSIVIMGTSVYAATFGPIASVMNNAGALATLATQTITGSTNAVAPRLRIASNVSAARATNSVATAQSARPIKPAVDAQAIASRLARIDTPLARGDTDSFRILAYNASTQNVAALNASRAQDERAFGRFMASDEPISQRISDAATLVNSTARDTLATILDSYSISLNRAGDASLALAADTRDIVLRSPEMSAALLDTYSNGMYAWVDGSQAVAENTTDAEIAAGPAAFAFADDAQQQTHALAIAAQSAVDAQLDSAHHTASLAANFAPHAAGTLVAIGDAIPAVPSVPSVQLPSAKAIINAEATSAPATIIASAGTFSPFNGSVFLRQGRQIALATYNAIHGFSDSARLAFANLLGYFSGNTRLAVVPLPPAITIPGYTVRIPQEGQAPADYNEFSYSGTTTNGGTITRVTNISNYFTGGGITKQMLDNAIDAVVQSNSNSGGGGGGTTIVQGGGGFSGGDLTAANIHGTGDTTIDGLLGVNGSITSNDEITGTFFTATSLSATSSLPNIISNSFSIAGDTITDFTGSGLAVVNGKLTATATSSNSFQQGGNTFGATATLGTQDANPLSFITNNLSRVFIDTNGNVGIGTTTPSSLLTIAGAVNGDTFTASGTGTSSLPRLATNALALGNEYVTGFTGNGLAIVGGVLGLDSANNYFSTTSSDFWFGTKNTDALAEGTVHQYFTPARADARINATSTIGTLLSAPNLGTLATTLTGIVKATGGVLSNAVAGTDYENPLTFGYPLQRTLNNVTLAFGTTTANVWGPLQTFGNTSTTNATSTTFNTNTLGIGGSYFTSLLGTGLKNTAGVLTLDTTGDWTGTFGGHNSTYYTTITNQTGVLGQANGGTGIGSYNPGDILYANPSGILTTLPISSNGSVLKIQAGTLAWGVDNTIGGGGSDGIFATSTGKIYPLDTSQTLLVGTNATSTANSIFEVNGSQYISSKLSIATTTAPTQLSVGGSGYFTGGLGIGVLNTVAGTLRTSGNANIGGNLDVTGLTTLTNATSTTFDTNTLGVAGSYFTSLLGSGLQDVGGVLTLDTSGNWSGTFGGHTSSFYLDATNLTNFGVPFYNFFHATTTDALAEGTTNLYFTPARADARINATSTISTLLSAPNLGTVNTSLTGLLKATSGVLSVATAGTDFLAPGSLSATYPILYSGNNFSLAFGTTTANSWSALQTFNGGASSTQLTTTGSTYLATTGGNVGIGSTSPAARLSVEGNALIHGTVTVDGLGSGLVKSTNGILGLASAGTDYSAPLTFIYPLVNAANSISLAFGTTTANSWSQLQQFNGGASTTQLTSTGNAYLATTGGKVGIGTTSPSQLLSVQGNGLFSGNLFAANVTATGTVASAGITDSGNAQITGGLGIGTANTTGGTIVTTGSITVGTQFLGLSSDGASAPSYSWAGDLTTGFYHAGANVIGFSTAGVGRAVIDASGNLGIGSSTPAAKLSVEGNALIHGTVTVDGLGTGLVKSTNGVLGVSVAGTDYENPLTFNAPLSRTVNAISIAKATLSVDGYLAAADFTLFNNKISSTSLSGGTGINYVPSTGVISNTGVLSLKQSFGTAQAGALTLGTSTVVINGQTLGIAITNSSGTFTFVPTLSGTLGVAGGGTGSTTLGGILKGNGTGAITSAVAGIDYSAPLTFIYPLVNAANSISLAFGTTTANSWSALQAFNGGLTATTINTTGAITSATQFLGNASDGASAPSFAWTGDITTGIFHGGSNVIGFSTSGIERARIDASGNLGLGSTTPSTRLSVEGNALIHGTVTVDGLGTGLVKSTNGILGLAAAGTDFQAPITATYPIQFSANNLSLAFGTTTANSWSQLQQFNGGASSTQLTTTGNTYLATTGGNVGVGTAAPAFTLDVAGKINTDQFSGYYQGGQLLAYASSTNKSVIFGLNAGGQSATTSATIISLTAVGNKALSANTTGNANSAFGASALAANLGGSNNNAFGVNALAANTTGSNNNAYGVGTLSFNSTGSSNSAFGASALILNTDGNSNSAFGVSALTHNDGNSNSAFGLNALNANTTGNQNIAFGSNGGVVNTTGSQNIFLGAQSNTVGTGYISTGNNNIGIGYNTLFPSTSANNQLSIGNFIFGTIPATTSASTFGLPTTGALGIGTSSPFAKLSVQTNNGDTASTLFAIGSSTASATTTLFSIGNTGVITSNALSTSTFATGLNLTSGCYAINGACVGGNTLSFSYPLTLSGTNVSLAFGTTTANAWSGLQTFNGGVSATTIIASGSITAGTQFLGNGSDGASAPSFAWTGDLTTGIFHGGSNVIGFTTSGIERARIDASGNLGLGTTSPATRLSVEGNALIHGTVTVDGLGTGLVKSTNGVLGLAAAGTDYSAPLTFIYPLVNAANSISLAFGTTTANTWSGLNTFNGGLTIGTFNGPLQANNGVVSATTSVGVLYGGTGRTSFTSSQLLYGNGTNGLTSVATTSFTPSGEFTVGGTLGAFVGGANSTLALATNGIALSKIVQIAAGTILGNNTGALGNVTAFATSTLFGTGTGGQILTWNNGVPQWVASTTYANGSGISTAFAAGQLTITNTGVLAVGPAGQTTNGTALFATSTAGTDFTITGSGSTITFNIPTASATNRGLLSSTDWSTFNNKQAGLTFAYPLVNTANTISLAFGTTTANSWSALQQFNGGASSTQLTTTGSTYLATAGGNVGIGTTTPGSLLSIGGIANFTAATSTFYSTGGINLTAGCYSVNGVCLTNSTPFTNTLANGGTATTTFYNGGVVYSDGSELTQATGSGASIFQWDNVNGRLGIGTSTPYAALSVVGTTTSTGGFDVDSNQNLLSYRGSPAISVLGTNNFYAGIGANGSTTKSTGNSNVFVGSNAGFAVSGNQNVYIGYQSGVGSTSGAANSASSNTAVGYSTLKSNTTGFSVNAFGANALAANSTGFNANAFGNSALAANTTGNQNNAFGSSALAANTTGTSNNSFGGNALSANITGGSNNAFGLNALNNNIVGNNNSAFGANTLPFSDSNENSAFGENAGPNVTTGSQNLFLGAQPNFGGGVGYITTGSNNIGIGYNTTFASRTANNQLNIGNFLYGTLPATTSASTFKLPTTGALGIGTTSPYAKFSIQTNNGDTATTLFAIGSSTASATTTLFSIDNQGDAVLNGNITELGTATSTFINGLSITGGCFAVNGVCLTNSTPFVNTLANGGTATTTFYSGGLVFSDGSKLTQANGSGASILQWNNTNGFLGIGTTSPYAALSVVGTTTSTGGFNVDGNTILLSYMGSTTLAVTGTNNFFAGIGANGPSGKTLGTDNVFIGSNAGRAVTSSQNVYIGSQSGFGSTTGASNTGTGNTALGNQTLSVNSSGNDNNAIGDFALQNNTTGSNNTAEGAFALQANTTGVGNSALGEGALGSNTTGIHNNAFGQFAFTNITTGKENVAFGTQAGYALTTGNQNIFLGANPNFSAAGYISTGSNNIGIGYNTLFPSATANNQLNLGNFIFGTLPATTSASTFGLPTAGALGIGTSSPYAKFSIQTNNGDTATTLFAIGSSTASATTTLFSISNTGALTSNALSTSTFATGLNITSGCYAVNGSCISAGTPFTNTLANGGTATTTFYSGGVVFSDGSKLTQAAGTGASQFFWNNTTGSLGIGTNAPAFSLDVAGPINTDQFSGYYQGGQLLAYASSTNKDTVFGIGAGGQNATTSASANSLTAIGYHALNANTTGANNSALGINALSVNTTGFSNNAFGVSALKLNTTGSANNGFGNGALQTTATGVSNNAFGRSALLFNSVGNGNTAIGDFAGLNSTGSDNVYLGAAANFSGTGYITSGSNNIGIGYNTLFPSATTDNQLNIGNFLYGNLPAATTSSSFSGPGTGTFGIGSSTPGSLLSIGNTNGINFSTGTSTFSSTGGINLTAGCYAVNGVCLTNSTPFTNTLANGGTATTTFYAGGVVYSDGSELTQATGSGASIFTWDNTNGRLGIGTSSPFGQLSVQGTSGGNSNLFTIASSTGPNSTIFNVANTGLVSIVGDIQLRDPGFNSFISPSPSAFTGQLTSSSVYGELFGSGTFFALTSIGPFNSVSGSGYSNITMLGQGNAASANNAIALGAYNTVTMDNGVAIGYGNTVNGDLGTVLGSYSHANGTSSVSIGNDVYANDDGNVAVGSFAYTAGSSSVAFGESANSGGPYSTALGSGAYANGFNAIALGRSTDAYGSTTIAIGYQAGANVDGAIAIGTGVFNTIGNSLQIGPSDASKLTILSSGNVGIGTTTPSALLSINANNGTTNTTLFAIGSSTASATTTLFSISNTGVLTSNALSTSTFATGLNITSGCYAVNGTCLGSGSGTVGSGLAGQFPYYAANGTTLTATSTLFLSANGNIGISTTTPNALLALQTPVGYGGQLFDFANSSGATLLHLSNAGNLGIGTSSPFATLSVNAAAGAIPFAIGSSSATLLKVDGTGQVTQKSFGTTNPIVFGADVGSSAYGAISLNGSLADTGMIGFFGGGISDNNFYFETPSTGRIIFRPNGGSGTTGVAQINANGISIGTSNNASALNVNGGVSIGNGYTNIAAPTNGAIIQGNLGIGTSSPFASLSVTGTELIDSNSANSFSIGFNGTTTKAFQVDNSAPGSGIAIVSKAPTFGNGNVNINGISNSANTHVQINAGGNQSVQLGNAGGSTLVDNAFASTFQVQFNDAASYTFFTDHIVNSPTVLSTAATARYLWTSAADTNLTANTEAPEIYYNLGATRAHASGAITTQRDFRITPSVQTFTAGTSNANSTIASSTALEIDGVSANGANGNLTNSYALFINNLSALTSSTTNAYGLAIQAPVGAANNYAAEFLGGNVGIGTTSPGSLLSIADTNGAINLSTGTSTFGTLGGINLTSGCYAVNGTCITAGTPFSNTLAGGGTATTTFYNGGLVYSDGSKLTQASGSGASILNWNNTSGFLGIGTTTPGSPLSVNGNSFFSGNVMVYGASTPNIAVTNDGTNIFNFGVATAATNYSHIAVTNDTVIRNFGAGSNGSLIITTQNLTGSIKFTTGSTVANDSLKAIITNAGNFGIGTSTPGSLLSINGIANFTAATSTFYSTGGLNLTGGGCYAVNGVCIGSGSFTNTLANGGTATTSFYSGGLVFSDGSKLTQANGSGASILSWNNTLGFLGIGTSSPAWQLSIQGTTGEHIKTTTNTTAAFAIENSVGSTTLQADTLDNATSIFSVATSSGATYFYIDASGNTGIGTTAPAAQFTTTGTVQLAHFGAGTLQTDAAGNVTVSSDERLKDVNGTFDRGLAEIEQLNPILYHWNATSGLDQSTQYAGFSAQNVQSVIPEAVDTDSRGYLTLQDRPIEAAEVNAIKELAGRTDALNISTTTLGTRVGAIETALAAQQAAGTVPAPVNATTISANSITTASLSVNGNAFATTFVAPATPITFTIGSTTGTLPTEVLADSGNGVDLYKAATYAITGVQSLQAITATLSNRIDSVELRVAMLEAEASSTAQTNSGTLSLASFEDLLGQIGVIVKNGIAHFTSLAFTNLIAAPAADGTSAVATSTIPMGDSQAVVVNNLAHPTSEIFVTITSPLNGSWYISQKGEGSFTINLSSPQTSDVTFDYFIVQTEKADGTQIAGAAGAPGAAQFSVGITGSPSTDASTTSASSTPSGTTANPPTISLNGDPAVDIAQGGFWTDPGASAHDAAGNDLTAQIAVTGSVDTNTPGLYTLNYSVVDSTGASAGVSRMVHVSAPTITSAPAPTDGGSIPAPSDPASSDSGSTPAPTVSDAPAPSTGG